MAQAKQFCISLENKPGMLAALCDALRRADVNVDALFVSHEEDICWVNLVATPEGLAQQALGDQGYDFFTEQVLVLRVDNETGALARVSSQLAEAGVNINYVYGGCTEAGCTVVFHVNDLEGAQKAVAP